MRFFSVISLVLINLFLLTGINVSAQTLQILQQQGHVDLKAWLEPTEDIATKQQVILVIDVGTDTWFSGGTEIGRFDVDNLLVLQRNKLATNYSERKLGNSWARQRWELTVYPLASGEYSISPIAVKVNITSGSREKVSGTIFTPPVRFKASLPAAQLTNETPWFSATNVEILQQWSIEAEQSIKVGDAITREISINAENTTAALIPKLLSTTTLSSQDSTAKLGRYYFAPDELTDTQPRGNYAAKRIEKVTFIAQKSGVYQAPDITLKWWNSDTNAVETITIPGQSYTIAHSPLSWFKYHALALVFCLFAAIALMLFLKKLINYYKTHPTPALLSLIKSLMLKQTSRTRLLIYRKLRQKTDKVLIAGLFKSNDNDKQNSSTLQEQWQRPFKSAQTNSLKAEPTTTGFDYYKIWLAIKKKSIKRVIFPAALPALEQYNKKRGSDE